MALQRAAFPSPAASEPAAAAKVDVLIHNQNGKKAVGWSVTFATERRKAAEPQRPPLVLWKPWKAEAPRRSVTSFGQMQNAKMSPDGCQRIQISPSVFKDRNPSEVKAHAAQAANLHID